MLVYGCDHGLAGGLPDRRFCRQRRSRPVRKCIGWLVGHVPVTTDNSARTVRQKRTREAAKPAVDPHSIAFDRAASCQQHDASTDFATR